MALTRFHNRKCSTDNKKINKIQRGLQYVIDETKTQKKYLVGGIGVDLNNPLEDMMSVKRFYGKTDGRQYIHFSISVKQSVPDDYIMFQIAEEIASFYKGFQIVWAVHTNTEHSHIHFIINSVSAIDGHKFSQSRAELKRFKSYVQAIIRPYSRYLALIENEQKKCEDSLLFDFQIRKSGSIEPLIFESPKKRKEFYGIVEKDDDTKTLIEPILFDSEEDRRKFYNM